MIAMTTAMTTALEARLSEVLEGVSCPFNFGNDDSNESAIAPKGSHDPIADSLPSIVSGNKLAKAYDISPSTLRGWLKNPPQPGGKQTWDKIQSNWNFGSDKKWYKRDHASVFRLVQEPRTS
jgi:hypothetical protein